MNIPITRLWWASSPRLRLECEPTLLTQLCPSRYTDLEQKKKDFRRGKSFFFWSKRRVSKEKTVKDCFDRCARAKQGVGEGVDPRRSTTMLASRRRTFRFESRKMKIRLPLRDNLIFWSKRRDSNPRSPVPETGAIPPSLRLEIWFYFDELNVLLISDDIYYITRKYVCQTFCENMLSFFENIFTREGCTWWVARIRLKTTLRVP